MANVVRTTSAMVVSVLGTDYPASAPDLTRYIKNASLIVDRVATCASDKGVPLTTEELLEIETWLAADRFIVQSRRYKSKATLSASGSWSGEGMEYRNAAAQMDPSGCLNAALNFQRASADWAGLTVNDQTDYWDRQ